MQLDGLASALAVRPQGPYANVAAVFASQARRKRPQQHVRQRQLKQRAQVALVQRPDQRQEHEHAVVGHRRNQSPPPYPDGLGSALSGDGDGAQDRRGTRLPASAAISRYPAQRPKTTSAVLLLRQPHGREGLGPVAGPEELAFSERPVLELP